MFVPFPLGHSSHCPALHPLFAFCVLLRFPYSSARRVFVQLSCLLISHDSLAIACWLAESLLRDLLSVGESPVTEIRHTGNDLPTFEGLEDQIAHLFVMVCLITQHAWVLVATCSHACLKLQLFWFWLRPLCRLCANKNVESL